MTDKLVRDIATGRDDRSASDGTYASLKSTSTFGEEEQMGDSTADRDQGERPHFLVDYMGGTDHRVEGVVIDGEDSSKLIKAYLNRKTKKINSMSSRMHLFRLQLVKK
jgi:hypothetical protein